MRLIGRLIGSPELEQPGDGRAWRYLVVPNAVHPALLGRLSDVADRVAAAVLEETPKKYHVATRGYDVAKQSFGGDIGIARSVMEDPCMLELLDLVRPLSDCLT